MTNATPTLLLDGIWGRPKRFEGMVRMLSQRVGPAEIFRYRASGLVRFEELGEQLVQAVERFDRPVNLVGFSMGGVVIRAAKLLRPELQIHKAAFLNTPHGGSAWAYALPVGGIRQMRFHDPFIRALKETPWEVPTIVSWCPMDTAVVPGRSARLACAEETVCCGVPVHVWPIFSGYIQGRVVEFFEEDIASKLAATREGDHIHS